MSNLIGKELGPYRILEQIGVGGMATVYKAYHAAMDRYVAVKVLPEQMSHDPRFRKRFEHEAKVIAKLEHVHILPVHDYGEDEGQLYLVLRYIEAGTLKERIAAGPLELTETQRILRQVGGALAHAHRLGVVHRDVKPGNVLLNAQGDCFLTDFGLARMMEASIRLTATGVGSGTPAYMSPEQGQGEKVDARSDIYSLGVMLYEMVTGRVPYEAETPMAVVIKHITAPLPLPSKVKPDLSPGVERVILKAMSKDPDDRFQTIEEMAAALEAAVRPAGDRAPADVVIDAPAGTAAPAPPTVVTVGSPARAEGFLARAASLRERLPAGWRPAAMWTAGGIVLILTLFLLNRLPFKVQVRDGQLVVLPIVEETVTPQAIPAATAKIAPTASPSSTPIPTPSSTHLPAATHTTRSTLDNSPTPTTGALPASAPVIASLGDTWVRPTDEMVMLYVPDGEFEMGWIEGSANELPVHTVALDSFWIDQTEVTNAQFATFLNEQGNQTQGGATWLELGYTDCLIERANGEYRPRSGYAGHPVIMVSWYGAAAYCKWAGGQLPTEAQWEYAARGIQGTDFPWGDAFDGERLNFCDVNCDDDYYRDASYDDGYAKTAPVGSFPTGESWCDALDMAGNAWEWVNDWYHNDYYLAAPSSNPSGPESAINKSLRGGSWNGNVYTVYAAVRNNLPPGFHDRDVGFRCAVTPGESQTSEVGAAQTPTPTPAFTLTPLPLAIPTVAPSGRVIHVDVNVVSSGDGSRTAPFDAIQAAINAAAPGDTIKVASGTYAENLVIEGKTLVLQGGHDPITWEAVGKPDDTIIDGGGRERTISIVGGSRVVIEGLVVTNGNSSCAPFGGGGILVDGRTTEATIRRAIIKDNVVTPPCGGGGLAIHQSATIAVVNSVIANNRASDGGGIVSGAATYILVANSTLVNNSPDGVNIEIGKTPGVFLNTIVWGNGALDIYGLAQVKHSLVSNVSPEVEVQDSLISVDPLFVDPVGGDYHLQPDSPAVDAGVLAGAPAVDLDGDPRPMGAGVDIGADEVSGEAATVTPTTAAVVEATATATTIAETSLPTATSTPPSASLGNTWTRPADGMVMVYVPAGEFEMGSSDEEVDYAVQLCTELSVLNCERTHFEVNEQPVASVTLDGFWIDQTEVTNDQYRKCVDAGVCQAPGCGYGSTSKADHPVACVDWYGARAYCEWAGARLPSEAEWEYAARGPQGHIYPWGDAFDGERLNFCDANCTGDDRDTGYDDGYEKAAPVGSFEAGASWCGALDMAGNLWEWTSSIDQGYPYRADDGREDPAPWERRVLRGGSWHFSSAWARSAHRNGDPPDNRGEDRGGIRCVVEPGGNQPVRTTTTSPTPPAAAAAPTPGFTAEQARAFAETILAAIADRQPDYEDDFGDPASGWYSYGTGCETEGGYKDDTYLLSASSSPPQQDHCGVHATSSRLLPFSDFVLEVDAEILSGEGGSWRVHFRRHMYATFTLLNAPSQLVKKTSKGEMILRQLSTTLEPGAGMKRATIVAQGSFVVVFMDGGPLLYGYDESPEEGHISLAIENLNDVPLQVHFDNFKIWDISNLSLPAPSPTPSPAEG